jgi:hypothetical protein
MNTPITQLLFKTWPYVNDIISPSGKLIAVDCSKDAVQISVNPTIVPITPSTTVTISPEAMALIKTIL